MAQSPSSPNPASHHVLVFGGGLAGTILADRLHSAGKRVLLIDDANLSQCSRIAAGIVNPIGGRRLKLVWMANTLIPFAKHYFNELEERLGAPIFHPRPIARLFASDEESRLWQKRRQDPHYTPWTRSLQSLRLPEAFAKETGFAVAGGGYLDTNTLLDILSAAAHEGGPERLTSRFDYEEIVPEPDQTVSFRNYKAPLAIFCEGHLANANPWFSFVRYKPAKGLIGTIETDVLPAASNSDELQPILIKSKFLVPRHDGQIAVGATYNWNDPSDTIDESGKAELESFLAAHLGDRWTWTSLKAGVRPATAGAYPVVGRHPSLPQFASFNGFGSKGSMQIPYLAEALVKHLYQDATLPSEVLPSRFAPKAKPARWKATDIAMERVLAYLNLGDTAIDATCGNGNDTHWLCQAVGPKGHVYACDLQAEAIETTRQRLTDNRLSGRTTFLHDSHANLKRVIPENQHGKITAIVFNLGYLPSSDKSLITKTESTLDALDASLTLLSPRGILSVTLYFAHPGGQEEAEAVLAWTDQLDERKYSLRIERHPDNTPSAPLPIFIIPR